MWKLACKPRVRSIQSLHKVITMLHDGVEIQGPRLFSLLLQLELLQSFLPLAILSSSPVMAGFSQPSPSTSEHHVDMTLTQGEARPAPPSFTRQDWQHSDHIKRESRHIYNKLHSIHHDASFIRRIHSLFPFLLLTANLRCGAWYTNPKITSAVSYFKSTDGHTHQWGFSLKRSNLHLVSSIVEAGGAMIVDSTRRGKSMPDALSKTFPIWCAVLNRASRRKYGCPEENVEGFGLMTPGWMIPPTEHDQIEARIDGFVEVLLDSDLDVPQLIRPLKPVFVTPQTTLDEAFVASVREDHAKATQIVLVSASRFVSDSASLGEEASTDIVGSQDRFVYVQGAGDDHENWARGLTPDLFWRHQETLLACDKEDLEGLVDRIVKGNIASASSSGGHWFTPLSAPLHGDGPATTQGTDRDIAISGTGIVIGSRAADHVFTPDETAQNDLVIHLTSLPAPETFRSPDLADSLAELNLTSPQSKVSTIHMTPNKKGLSSIRTAFPSLIEQVHRTLTSPPAGQRRVLVCCQDGKDLSGSLVVAILASCFTDQRTLLVDSEEFRQHKEGISKDTTKRRLQWLVSANPRSAPSRAFLLRVNELLISHRHKPGAVTTPHTGSTTSM